MPVRRFELPTDTFPSVARKSQQNLFLRCLSALMRVSLCCPQPFCKQKAWLKMYQAELHRHKQKE